MVYGLYDLMDDWMVISVGKYFNLGVVFCYDEDIGGYVG